MSSFVIKDDKKLEFRFWEDKYAWNEDIEYTVAQKFIFEINKNDLFQIGYSY